MIMSEDDRTLWVGNLTDFITEELLYELFLQAGPLQKVTIPKSVDGRRRRFGFVTFKHSVSVPYSVQLFANVSLFGSTLNIKARQGSAHNNVSTPTTQVGSPQDSPQSESSPQSVNQSPRFEQNDEFLDRRNSHDSRLSERYPNQPPTRSYSFPGDHRQQGTVSRDQDPRGHHESTSPNESHSSKNRPVQHALVSPAGQHSHMGQSYNRDMQPDGNFSSMENRRHRVLQQQSLTLDTQGHRQQSNNPYNNRPPWQQSQGRSHRRY